MLAMQITTVTVKSDGQKMTQGINEMKLCRESGFFINGTSILNDHLVPQRTVLKLCRPWKIVGPS